MTTNEENKKIQPQDTKPTRLNSFQQEILKRWQKKKRDFITQEIKDTLKIKFNGEILFDEPMAKHSYIKVGGKADVFLKPSSKEDLLTAVKLAQENGIPYYFHGSGANTLVRDGGIRGFVISVYKEFNEHSIIEKTDNHIDILADSGLQFSKLVNATKDLGLSDIIPLAGIPGSIGGIVKMNAGTPAKEIKDVVRNITIFTKEGEEKTLSREHLDFEYRALKLSKSNIILSVLFRFQDFTSPEEADALMQRYQESRTNKQPLEFPSLGSVFKNPQPVHKSDMVVSAGQLIDEAGLKNIRIGGARISLKHANFIVNEGNAKASDVIALINLIKDKVKQSSSIVLETEIKIVGEDLE